MDRFDKVRKSYGIDEDVFLIYIQSGEKQACLVFSQLFYFWIFEYRCFCIRGVYFYSYEYTYLLFIFIYMYLLFELFFFKINFQVLIGILIQLGKYYFFLVEFYFQSFLVLIVYSVLIKFYKKNYIDMLN